MKTLSFNSVLILILVAICCAQPPENQITILHTNDLHSQLEPVPATWVNSQPKPLIGGIAALDYHVQQQKAKFPQSLLLDAGDISTGTPVSKIEYNGALNGGFAEMLNIIGYDALTLGNHEFDEGQDNLKKLMSILRADVLCANVFVDDQLFAERPFTILKRGSVRIGIIGFIVKDLFQQVALKQLAGVVVKDPLDVAQEIIDEIDPVTDLIILLTHEGIDDDLALARNIRNADIIVGGHSHSRLEKPVSENGILIVQADSKSRYLGRLTVTVCNDQVDQYDYELVPTWADDVQSPHLELQNLINQFNNEINIRYSQVIGTLHADWKRFDRGESNIGNFLTDVMRETLSTDFAVINSGGIRKDLAAGPIKKLDIVEILPFTNYLVTFKCTGRQILTMLQKNAQMIHDKESGMLQLSGLQMTYSRDRDNNIKLVSAAVQGQPVDVNAQYKGTTIDFITFGQALNILGFEPDVTENSMILIADAVTDYIVKHPDVKSGIEGRIRQISR